MLNRIFLFSLFLLLLGTPSSFSQTGNFTHFGVEDGLPQSTVSTLIQDKQGNLWIGTNAGVSRYNGLAFYNLSKKDGLTEDRVTATCLDKDGNILFGHWGGGISRYILKTNKLESVSMKNLMVNKPISAILQDSKNTLWIATEGLGLLKVFPGDTSGAKLIGQKEGLFSKNIFSMIEDPNGVIWFGTDIGITKFFPKENRFEKVFYDHNSSEDVRCLFMEDSNHIWVGTRDAGLIGISIDHGKEKFTRLTMKDGLPDNHITSICKDKDSFIWVGTASGGLACLTSSSGDRKNIRKFNTSQGLGSNRIQSVFSDREGNVWLGSFLGLEKFSRHDFELFNILNENEKGIVWAIQPFGKNKFILGTETGIFSFDHEESSTGKVVERLCDVRERVNSVVIDKQGTIWGSAWGKGLFSLSGHSGTPKWINLNLLQGSKFIHALTKDHQGNIWLGLLKGGVIRFNPQNLRSESFGVSDGFRSNTVQTIFCDSKGTMWFGTQGGFLTKYDGHAFYTFTEKEGLNSNAIISITEDHFGNIYCGTYGEGLYKFNGKAFEHFESEKNKTPVSLLFDQNNRLWVGVGTGINEFLFTKNPNDSIPGVGVTGIEVTPNAVYEDESKNLWFGSLTGIVKYSPSGSLKNSEEPITQITQLQVYFKEHEMTQKTKLSYNENYLSFYFTGVSLTDPKKVLYSYRLTGIDRRWSPPIRENYINYPNLSPGKYTFEVKACNNDGIWNKDPASFTFIIAAPYWQTWWFRTLYICIGVLGLFLFFRIRIRQIRKQEEVKTELNKKIANIELKALRAQMNPHFIFNTLNSIQHFVIHNDSESAQKYMSKFADLIRSILTHSGLSYIPLEEELRHLNLYLELESLRFENKFEFEIIADQGLKNENVEIPSMLIQPYIENAIVHGLMHKEGKGKISVRLDKIDQVIKCSIEDNGIGRKKAQEYKAKKRPGHRSMGLAITGERLEILNQMNEHQLTVKIIDLQDEAGNATGTLVELFIPMYTN